MVISLNSKNIHIQYQVYSKYIGELKTIYGASPWIKEELLDMLSGNSRRNKERGFLSFSTDSPKKGFGVCTEQGIINYQVHPMSLKSFVSNVRYYCYLKQYYYK